MKLTDFAILVGALLLSLTLIWGVFYEVKSYEIIRHDRIDELLDEVVTDALIRCFDDVDNEGLPIIDENNVVDEIVDEMSFIMYGDCLDNNIIYLKNKLRLVMVREGDNVYVYECGKKTQELVLTGSIDDKRKRVIELIEDVTGSNVYLPYNGGEEYAQALETYSLTIMFKVGDKYTFSSAAIKKKR